MLGFRRKTNRPKVAATKLVRHVRARFDSATTNDANRRHWSAADALSADAAASPGVRQALRNRARYEVANNSYARGIVLTLANDTIGTGPRLQMLTSDVATNAAIELEFTRWTQAIRLPEKLRAMRMARAESGESFFILGDNPGLDSPVTLDARLIEADQVATPTLIDGPGERVDGIVFDRFGNPIKYHVLKHHPGAATLVTGFGLEADVLPASAVIHDYRIDRPGQSRGIPDITPALPLFALLRRYTLASVSAAELAANFAGVLYTDAPANDEADSVEPMDTIELEANAMLTLPAGWKMGQVKAEHPSTQYSDFKRELLNEIARCLNMPFNVAAGNSSGYNFASGKLDHQVYFKSIRVDQEQIGRIVLNRLLAEFLREAVLVPGLLPFSVRTMIANGAHPPHQWFWDGQSAIDPLKEANAQAMRIKNHTTTLAHEYATQGRDWEVELRQRAKEVEFMNELGLGAVPAPTSKRGNRNDG